jgi:glutathione S-transferase
LPRFLKEFTVTNRPPITLRYFDARGRAQFLRYYFRIRDVHFTDERVALSADFAPWQAIRDDRSLTGPFRKLPVLQFGDRLVSETLMIAAFVHEALGDGGSLNDDDNLRHGMLTSSLCQDIMTPIAVLIWTEVSYPGVELGPVAKRTLERLQQHLASIEQSLIDWRWQERSRRRRVMLADCLLWEELDVATQVFGPHLSLAATPLLESFHAEFSGREQCQSLLSEQPCPITARPDEPAAIETIQRSLG